MKQSCIDILHNLSPSIRLSFLLTVLLPDRLHISHACIIFIDYYGVKAVEDVGI